MGVRGKAGRKSRKSIIYQHNLQDSIVELHMRGLNYTEICRVINEKSDVKINRMQISRFLTQLTPDDMKSNVITNMRGIRDRTIENNIRMLSDYDLSMNDIITLIDTSNLSNVDKGILKKQVISKLKGVRNSLISSRGELIDIFQQLNSTISASNMFLMSVSSEMCYDCRRKIVDGIKRLEAEEGIEGINQ